MHTVEITKQSFQTTMAKPGIVLLDFWAPWCGPCRAFAPVFESAAKRHVDVTFGKVNTDDQPELASEFQIQAIPTLMAFRDGVLLFEQPGMLPAQALDTLVEQIRKVDMNEVRRKIAEKSNVA